MAFLVRGLAVVKSELGIIKRFHVLVSSSGKRSYQVASGSTFPAHQMRLECKDKP
jgi:hypothetical protein